ncbi:MAG: extracellular solute-binding protein [Acidaminococcaceae bacterium]|nr:extracellular solute-binding protein [Acidaminococcaceae bacterium]
MKRKLFFPVLACLLFLLAGCGSFNAAGPAQTVKVYTTLDKTFAAALCGRFTDSLPQEKKIEFVVSDKEDDLEQADCIISGSTLLQQKAAAGSLQKIDAEFADLLPAELKDKEERWVTLFYDPAVLLINQAYSRKAGQQQLLHWSDVPQQTEARIIVENLSDNESTINFLAAMSSRMGQDECLAYFRRIRPLIRQFAKFPITPVRMAATGDADIAITRRSHVFKYLQNDFPAYILIPGEGTPVNLFGIGVSQGSKRQKEISAFINWLLSSSEARTLLMTTRSGYLPVLPKGENGQAVNMDVLWTNTFYKNGPALEQLAADWLREIRLADAGEDTK